MESRVRLSVLLVLLGSSVSVYAGLFGSTVLAQTWVEGHITQDTTWTLVNSPYRAIGDVFVDAEVLLTIEPGVEVQFADGYSLVVDGSLSAAGTDGHSIVFTSSRLSPSPGAWNTIKFRGDTNEQFLLKQTKVEYAVEGVTIESLGLTTIEMSEISKCSNNGILLVGESNVAIRGNTIEMNKEAIYSFGKFSGIQIINNSIWHNDYGGILISTMTYPRTYSPLSNVTISDNTILYNGHLATPGEGIQLFSDGHISNVDISRNTISHSYRHGLFIVSCRQDSPIYDVTISGNTISHNAEKAVYVYAEDPRSPISNATISGNTISHNSEGICLLSEEIGPNVDFIDNIVSFSIPPPQGYYEPDGIWVVTDVLYSSTFDGNVLLVNARDGLHIASRGRMHNVTVTNNIASSNWRNGIYVQSSDDDDFFDASIMNNVLASNSIGITARAGILNITNNSVCYNGNGISYERGSENNLAYDNDIYSNNQGMWVFPRILVNAEWNYWGHSTGPYHPSLCPEGEGNPVNGNGTDLDFIPFHTSPVGPINARPIAVLDVDKTNIGINETVTFSASASTDDDRIRYYFFDFGDGKNTGWIESSVVQHKYSLHGSSEATYDSKLTVMDNFGAQSNNIAMKTITVSEETPSFLHISLSLNPSIIQANGDVSVDVNVTDGTTAIGDVFVQLVSDNGGEFSQSSGNTDSSGHFSTSFKAPTADEETNVRVTATASKSGYTDGSDYKYLTVVPSGTLLSVTITIEPNEVWSGEASTLTIQVTDGINPIAEASVTLHTDERGTFSSVTGNTDSNGFFTTMFTAPSLAEKTVCTIAANATKTGYYPGQAQNQITVNPGQPQSPSSQPDQTLWTYLAIFAVILFTIGGGVAIARRKRRPLEVEKPESQ